MIDQSLSSVHDLDLPKITQNDVVFVDSNSSSPTVTHVTPEVIGRELTSVTSLGDDVFVMRSRRVTHVGNLQEIEVYDANTFTLQRHITVHGLSSPPNALTACPYNNCLYASIRDKRKIRRVDLSLTWMKRFAYKLKLSRSNVVMKWSVALWPRGLSVNSEHNVLVVSQGNGECKLQIFTTHGTLLQDIQLQADIEYPRHDADVRGSYM